VENATGDLWLSGVGGWITRVPATVRHAELQPPQVFVTSVRSARGTHDPHEQVTVPYERNRLELEFSAPSFGRGAPAQYRFRLEPTEPWSSPISHPTLQLAALAPGRYVVEVQASTDGTTWSPEPARVELRVRAPWFLQGWFVGSAIGLMAAGTLVVRQARKQAALNREAQRARIARDLHDEIGSGLGTIGLLAGLASRRSSSATDQVDEIEMLAGELGTSLTDIVTSLRSGAGTLRSLHRHVVDRGRRLCSTPSPRFEAAPSESVPAISVSPAVRINVLLIAVEAIHNAVRHARARTIQLDLTRLGRRTWVLTVVDDGIGMPVDETARPEGAPGGMGLANLRSRAAEIGAELDWSPTPGGGTTVRLVFAPEEGSHWFRWFRLSPVLGTRRGPIGRAP